MSAETSVRLAIVMVPIFIIFFFSLSFLHSYILSRPPPSLLPLSFLSHLPLPRIGVGRKKECDDVTFTVSCAGPRHMVRQVADENLYLKSKVTIFTVID